MKKKVLLTRKTWFIILFLLPGILLYAVIYAYPLINIFATSFTNWNFKNLVKPEFVGFDNLFKNYTRLFTNDYYFPRALTNSLKWVALTIVVQVPVTVLVSFILSKKLPGWRFARNVYIIPNIISTAAIGLIFLNLYSPSRGVVTEIAKMINPASNLNVLADEKLSFWGVTLAFIFFTGSSTLLVLTQIFSISTEVEEAARVDGASPLQIDLKIKLPLLRPIIGTVAILATNYGLLLYNEIALITGGGPDNATYSLSYYIYQTAMGSSKLNFALANTAGVIQFILGIVFVGLINKAFRTGESNN